MPQYCEYSTIQNYIAILENAAESLNKKVDELQAALDHSHARALELEKENQKLRQQLNAYFQSKYIENLTTLAKPRSY